MDYDKYLSKSKEKYNELDQMKKDTESMESAMMKPKMKHLDSNIQNIDSTKNFTMTPSRESKTDYNVAMQIDENIKNLAELDTDTIIADLENLSKTHPDRFKRPSDVFRLIRTIKENPTHFYRNNRLDMHLIGKFLENDSFAEMGVVADSGRVGHILKVSDGKKRARSLNRRNNEGSLVGIVNSDTLTQDEMDELAQDALLANSNENVTDNTLNKTKSEESSAIITKRRSSK